MNDSVTVELVDDPDDRPRLTGKQPDVLNALRDAATRSEWAKAYLGQGFGAKLLGRLVSFSEENGFWSLQAAIFPENQVSIATHKKCGFVELGLRNTLGKMTYGPHAGKWRDDVFLERRSLLYQD